MDLGDEGFFFECGKRIKSQRINRSLTQGQLGELVNISEGYMSKIECGAAPSIQILINLFQTLNLSLDELIFPVEKSNERVQAEAALASLSESKLPLACDLLVALSKSNLH